MSHAFHRAIIEIDVRDLDIRRQAGRIDGKTVVLAGDADFAAAQILDRLVAAAVTKFEFESLAAVSVSQKLVTQADGEDGLLADQGFDFLMDVAQRGRITGAVGKEDAIGIFRQYLLGSGRGRHHFDTESVLPQVAQDVGFDAEIVGHDVVLCRRQIMKGPQRAAFTVLARAGDVPHATFSVFRVPYVGLWGGHFLHVITATHRRTRLCRFDGLFHRQFSGDH